MRIEQSIDDYGEIGSHGHLWWENPKDLWLGTEDLKYQAEESEGLPLIQKAAIKERTRQPPSFLHSRRSPKTRL